MFIIYASTSSILVLIASLVENHFFSPLSSLRLFPFTNVLQIAPLIVVLTVQYSNHVAVLENSTRAASESSTCTLALSYASPPRLLDYMLDSTSEPFASTSKFTSQPPP